MAQVTGAGRRVRGGRDLQQVLIEVPGERVPCPYWGTRGAAWCMGYQAARSGTRGGRRANGRTGNWRWCGVRVIGV